MGEKIEALRRSGLGVRVIADALAEHDADIAAVAAEAARRERDACAALVRRMADPVRDSCAAADVVAIYDQIADMLEARNG